MKLIHSHIDVEFDFDKNSSQLLIIENSSEFFELTHQLYRQCEGAGDGEWVLSDDSQILSLQKLSEIITEYYSFSLNNKKIENLLNGELLSLLKSGDYFEEFSLINKNLIAINEDLSMRLDFPVSYSEEFLFEDFIKFSHYKINENLGLTEKLLTYIDIYVNIKNIKLAIFVNLFSILSEDDIKKLLKQLEYMQIKVFFIESQLKYDIKSMQKTIIDNDLCVI